MDEKSDKKDIITEYYVRQRSAAKFMASVDDIFYTIMTSGTKKPLISHFATNIETIRRFNNVLIKRLVGYNNPPLYESDFVVVFYDGSILMSYIK